MKRAPGSKTDFSPISICLKKSIFKSHVSLRNQRFLGKSELIFFHINTHKSIFLSSLFSSSVSQLNHNNIRGKKSILRRGIYFVFIGKNSYRLDKHCSKLLSSQSVFALQSVSATFTLTQPVPLRITTPCFPLCLRICPIRTY